ncbi:hypothetical protein T552_00853 [Pneumocystis carinii B80]|uniref:Uncharacterized protein n=1 Tax=Pneumocystis carinii (strain B80) TaxID=1408658 RepID=A0A0W4ZMP0_PNEC8|nr:hypothetical protein T552_00853 [Pneumocystis carinii B80]KTW29645.1 hypothetical protein T552_00853 [Pneumocystis carinii B80]
MSSEAQKSLPYCIKHNENIKLAPQKQYKCQLDFSEHSCNSQTISNISKMTAKRIVLSDVSNNHIKPSFIQSKLSSQKAHNIEGDVFPEILRQLHSKEKNSIEYENTNQKDLINHSLYNQNQEELNEDLKDKRLSYNFIPYILKNKENTTRHKTDNTCTDLLKYTKPDIMELKRIRKEFVEQIDEWDTTMAHEYSDEIFAYMHELEVKYKPSPTYIEHQPDMQWSMRSVLIDWLIQVHSRFHLLPETLYLTINLIDRFLSVKVVSLPKLQLVGATALFLASKYEEIICPSVHEIVYMVDYGYSSEEILKAERYMINMLNFDLGWPGPMSFLRRVSKADEYDLDTRTLTKYLLELTVMDFRFIGILPSFIVAAAHYLSRCMLEKGSWTDAHVYYSSYTERQLLPLVSIILQCLQSPKKHHNAIYEKYADKKFKKASKFVESWMAKHA